MSPWWTFSPEFYLSGNIALPCDWWRYTTWQELNKYTWVFSECSISVPQVFMLLIFRIHIDNLSSICQKLIFKWSFVFVHLLLCIIWGSHGPCDLYMKNLHTYLENAANLTACNVYENKRRNYGSATIHGYFSPGHRHNRMHRMTKMIIELSHQTECYSGYNVFICLFMRHKAGIQMGFSVPSHEASLISHGP